MIVSSNNVFAPSFTFPLELTLKDLFHIEMKYEAASRTLTTTMQRNGEPFGPIKPVVLGGAFSDYRVDALAIASYNDSGADGSLLAAGTIDNIALTIPDPPIAELQGAFQGNQWTTVVLSTLTNWVYTLERTEDWRSWTQVSPPVQGTGNALQFHDAPAPSSQAFYRVRLERP